MEFASTGLLFLPDLFAHKLILLPARKSAASSSKPSLFISIASNHKTNPATESAKRLPKPMEKDLLTGGAAKKRSSPAELQQ